LSSMSQSVCSNSPRRGAPWPTPLLTPLGISLTKYYHLSPSSFICI
jgi:hypothetical protein